MPYLFLIFAIALECAGTALMKLSEGFSQLLPSIGCIAVYALCFFCLSKSLTGIPLAVAYATWGALGIVLATVISAIVFKEAINPTLLIGVGLCIAGTIVVNIAKTA